MICRKGTVALPDANFLSPWCQYPSSRAQNWYFCAFLPFGTPVFGLSEHKIEFFVRFCQQEELNELDELDEQEELNEQDKLNELNEQEELNGRVR